MKYHIDKRGQAIVETALVLVLLLIIFIGMAEFSRAWFTKNSYKNAVRSGARVACVTLPSDFPLGVQADGNERQFTCGGTNVIINAVCTSPGVKGSATAVFLTIDDNDADGAISPGDTVRVKSTFNDPEFFVLGNSPWPWPKGLTFSVDASMRYE